MKVLLLFATLLMSTSSFAQDARFSLATTFSIRIQRCSVFPETSNKIALVSLEAAV
jgi:hypothetical protein